jgi:hypothetical protein
MKTIFLNKLVLFVVLCFCTSNISFGQELNTVEEVDSVFANYLLVNSVNQKKIIELKDNGPYNLAYVQKLNDSLRAENIFLLSGNIRYLNENDLDFDIRNEAIEQNFKDGSIISTQNDYSSFYYSGNQDPRKINLGDIEFINYSTPTRSVLHSIGVSTMFISAATTLILAPILNISFPKDQESGKLDFGNPNFNSNGYMNVAKVGLIGFATSIPITLLTKTKQYNITTKNKKEVDSWYLEKVENISNK